MKNRVLILGMGISMGLANLASAAIPSPAEVQAAAAEPMDFIDVLNKASGVEMIQALEQVSKALPEVESTIGIENRIIGITAIGLTIAEENAPAAAAAILNAIPDDYKPLVAATAVLISGKKSNAVRRSLLSAVSEGQHAAVKVAVNNPRKSVLDTNQANLAAQYARMAVRNSFASNALYFELKDGASKGASGNSSGLYGKLGIDISKLPGELKAFFSSEDSKRLLDLLSQDTWAQFLADYETFGLPCARQRTDMLKKGLLENDPFWSDVEFIRKLSCQSIAAIRHLDPNSLASIRRLGSDSVDFDIAINKYKGQLINNNTPFASGVGLTP